jgi:hypothetical protein
MSMFEKGQIKPVISKTFGFEEPQEAFRFLSTGNSIGKIVVTKDGHKSPIVPVCPCCARVTAHSG